MRTLADFCLVFKLSLGTGEDGKGQVTVHLSRDQETAITRDDHEAPDT